MREQLIQWSISETRDVIWKTVQVDITLALGKYDPLFPMGNVTTWGVSEGGGHSSGSNFSRRK